MAVGVGVGCAEVVVLEVVVGVQGEALMVTKPVAEADEAVVVLTPRGAALRGEEAGRIDMAVHDHES